VCDCGWLVDGQFQRHLSSTSSEDSNRGGGGSLNGSSTPPTAKEYVMSLHQNPRSVLLYGKNNVSVQPVRTTLHQACSHHRSSISSQFISSDFISSRM